MTTGREEGWIGVDLDGTLASYSGWKGHQHIGLPVDLMVNRVRAWLLAGTRVKIFTARVARGPDDPTYAETVERIQNWCEVQFGVPLEITCVKDFACVEIWDDRCVQVLTNKGIPVLEPGVKR